MKLITIRSQIIEVLDKWKLVYPAKTWPDKQHIISQLEKLNLNTASAEDIEAIIGNNTWAGPTQCDECKGYFDEVIEVGDEPYYESNTAYLCEGCTKKAVALFDS